MVKRRDLRDWCIFTIDPPTAKDLDDALSINPRPDGQPGYEIGVHIADVRSGWRGRVEGERWNDGMERETHTPTLAAVCIVWLNKNRLLDKHGFP